MMETTHNTIRPIATALVGQGDTNTETVNWPKVGLPVSVSQSVGRRSRED